LKVEVTEVAYDRLRQGIREDLNQSICFIVMWLKNGR